MNRKEFLKKALGLNEYPWSSDDENENPPPTSLSGGPPPADASPTSPQQGSAQNPMLDRNFFWSLAYGRKMTTVPRTIAEMDLEVPPPRAHQPPAEARAAGGGGGGGAASRCPCPSADIQRILAFRRVGSSRPSAARTNRALTRLITAPLESGVGSIRPFTDASSPIRARVRAVPRDSGPRPDIIDIAYAVSDANRGPSPRRRRSPPAPPIRIRIGTQLTSSLGRAPRPPAAPCCPAAGSGDLHQSDDDVEMGSAGLAEAGGSGRREDVPMLGGVYEMDMLRPAAADNGQVSGGGEATGGAGSNTSASPLGDEVVEIDGGADVTAAPAAVGTGSASAADTAAAEGTAVRNGSGGDVVVQPHGLKRKIEDTEEKEPKSVQEFNLSLLQLLECPVCLEWMEPPMSQCRRGHLVCGRCRARLAACPVCRTAFSSVRNRAMEGVAEMLRYPCRHGCGREVRLRRRVPHEASCSARRYRCVLPACTQRAMPHHELAEHIQSEHAAIVKVGRKHKFALMVNAEQHDAWVVMALHELFHVRVDVDARTWAAVVHVAYIGPKCNANNYSYEVTVLGQHHSRKLVYTRATHCDLESSTLNLSRQDCFHLTMDQALNFLRAKNKHGEPDKMLHFHVEITKRDDLADINMDECDLS